MEFRGESKGPWVVFLSLSDGVYDKETGFPCGSAGKESACNAGGLGSIPGLRRFPWRRERLPTPVFWPGEVLDESMGSQRVGHDWATFTSLHIMMRKHLVNDWVVPDEWEWSPNSAIPGSQPWAHTLPFQSLLFLSLLPFSLAVLFLAHCLVSRAPCLLHRLFFLLQIPSPTHPGTLTRTHMHISRVSLVCTPRPESDAWSPSSGENSRLWMPRALQPP